MIDGTDGFFAVRQAPTHGQVAADPDSLLFAATRAPLSPERLGAWLRGCRPACTDFGQRMPFDRAAASGVRPCTFESAIGGDTGACGLDELDGCI